MLAIAAKWHTPGCAQINGLAIDAAHDRIFLGCFGNDGVVFDADLRRVFHKPFEALGTKAGIRTFVIHPKAKMLAAVTAEGSADNSR